jgi:hypothetical protein
MLLMPGSPFTSCEIRWGACESTPATSISMLQMPEAFVGCFLLQAAVGAVRGSAVDAVV